MKEPFPSIKKTGLILLLAITLTWTSCAGARNATSDPSLDAAANGIDALLDMCEKDLKNAGKVISSNDIIKNLSHLQLMNKGGNKYYPLERENISKMILSVTEGIYGDFILINAKGLVLYTMVNDDIFGKNVRTTLSGTPLKDCFDAKTGIHFCGLDAGEWGHFHPSIKIDGDERASGNFVLQIDREKLRELIPESVTVLSPAGKVLISHNKQTEGTMSAIFQHIAADSSGTILIKGKAFSYRRFKRANIDWIIVKGGD